MTRSIIIDTDPGMDDVLAIMLAAASPEVDIIGITAVAGNTGLEHTARNAAALADLLALTCPVGAGAAAPMWRRDTQPATHVHGDDGLRGYQLPPSTREIEPAIELLRRLVDDSATPVTLVPIGPLTNIALFMATYPDTARKVEHIVLMGGGTGDHLGNATPAAEFNIYFDPDAAARVFDFGVPITMVGLNVTNRALIAVRDFAPLVASGGPIAEMVTAITLPYIEHADSGGEGDEAAAAQHDSLAVAAVIRPDLLKTEHLYVDVENVGRLTSGMTVVDFHSRTGQTPNCHVAVDVDVEAFTSLLVSRLTQLDSTLKQGD